MAYWIELHDDKQRLLGSDSTVRLDGRWGLERAIDFGFHYARDLKRAVKPQIKSFYIMHGTLPSNLKRSAGPYPVR